MVSTVFARGVLIALLGIATAFPALSQPKLSETDPDLLALLNARASAESAAAAGSFQQAAMVLAQSLRACPPARAELADAAYGNGQMASYLLLHVMPENDAYHVLLNQLQPEVYVTDKMLKLLCFIAVGLNQEQKTELSQEITYLTSSENQIVQTITRFYLSNPYFYDNDNFTNQFAQMLASDYPNLELTQVSLNLSLYKKTHKDGLDSLVTEFRSEEKTKQALSPWSQRLRARIEASGVGLKDKDTVSRETALAPLIEGIEKGEEWQERHFSLLLMKGEMDGELAPALVRATRSLARRKSNTPDVLQARALLAAHLSGPDSTEEEQVEAMTYGRSLLREGVDILSPERVMWETRVYSIQTCAANLAKVGKLEEMVELYDELADQLPGSKIEEACRAALSSHFHNKPKQTTNAAK